MKDKAKQISVLRGLMSRADVDSVTRTCKYLDEYHFQTLGSGGDTYHICQFAEIMERIGARYEPEVQLRGVEVVPFAPGEEKFCTFNREEGNTCVGHISGDFGQQGDRFHSSWRNHKTRTEQDWDGISTDFQSDLHGAVYALRQGLLKDFDSMMAFCQNHPEAKLPDRNDLEHYGFKLDAGNRQYFVLCCLEESSYNSRFIIHAYDQPAPVLEQEKPSVLKQIRDAQKAPKPPRKAKVPDKKKDGAEL
jgi:hypothetical protein